MEQVVLEGEAHATLKISLKKLKNPEKAGYLPSMGIPSGQEKTWRKKMPDGRSLHLKRYETHYTLHYDTIHPEDFPTLLAHVKADLGDYLDLIVSGARVVKRITQSIKDRKGK